ncbi:MAG: outer membrane protein assembly factor BamB family protein [Anaerolineae bacterium]
MDKRLFVRVVLVVAIGLGAAAGIVRSQQNRSQYLPLVLKSDGVQGAGEWTQHAFSAQRTSYNPQSVPPPWRWRWSWNGPDSAGAVRKVTSNGTLPRNVQPVTGGGRVYVAAGADGVYALRESDGALLWQATGLGRIMSTVAYDRATQAVFAVSAAGQLHKLRADTGVVLSTFATGSASSLPLPPAVLSDRVLFSMGRHVYAVDKQTMGVLWAYDAGAAVETPPAYSASRDVVIVGSEDLFVHAIQNSSGTRRWRIKPCLHQPGDPSSSSANDYASYRNGWPVVADAAGVVLIKAWLDWETLWTVWPQTNNAMRSLLSANPLEQSLFVMNLDDGTVPYVANVGHGGFGDGGYMPMGTQPVVKRLPNGKDVVYTIVRAKHAHDARWDSHFGEMVLDNSTVGGLQGGDVRFIAYDWPPGATDPFLLTDEQPNVSMAGDHLFGGHWEAGLALRILDRSEGRGSFANKITSERLASVVTSQDVPGACAFSPTHYCSSGLEGGRPYDWGFYIYYNQGAVYDRYWSEYAVWVVSNDNLYFRSTDGAIVALTSGNPHQVTGSASARIEASQVPAEEAPVVAIAPEEARIWVGRTVTVSGELRYVFNNGKQVLLGFANPHRGMCKVLIRNEDWPAFGVPPEELYSVGQRVSVTGKLQWYQGDPAIVVRRPQKIVLQP